MLSEDAAGLGLRPPASQQLRGRRRTTYRFLSQPCVPWETRSVTLANGAGKLTLRKAPCLHRRATQNVLTSLLPQENQAARVSAPTSTGGQKLRKSTPRPFLQKHNSCLGCGTSTSNPHTFTTSARDNGTVCSPREHLGGTTHA